MFTTILVPLDGSEFADRALETAGELARLSDAAITLLSVMESGGSPPARGSDPAEDGRAAWAGYLEERAAALRAQGVPEVTTDLRAGDPARHIVEAAREAQADVIVMSTEGLGSRGQYALGSVALKVLMTAPCPVFMVRINRPEPPRNADEERWQEEGGGHVG
jgi:nucleotide-binding universal stress UspA family protein